LRTRIVKFNFKFQLSDNLIPNQDASSLLESFRSSFWLEQRRWYVGYYSDESKKYTIVYSMSPFRIRTIDYPSHDNSTIEYAPTPFPFEQNRLFYMQFKQTNYTAKSSVYSRKIIDSHRFITHTPRINRLSMNFDPLFIIPSLIRFLLLEGLGQSISIDALSHTISSVERLQIYVESKQMIIDRLQTHTYRLNSNDFTCRYFGQFYPSIYLSIGNRCKEKNNENSAWCLYVFTIQLS
jgi:hypothetical protein